jgi:dTDP-3-amino-3,4,6-trideoxy-alpha-D-glucose transaminase
VAVPLFDTRTPLEPLLPRLRERAAAVLDAGRYVLGPEVEGFERELADYVGVRHAVGVANGTDALTVALRALGVGAGDEVVVPSFTFYASAEAIPPTGAIPVFADVDPDTFCVTPDTIRAAVTPRTKVVIAVDLFGNVAPTPEIEAEVGLPVLVDSAQAAGSVRRGGEAGSGGVAKAGSFGAAATLSFFPSKNLGGFGDGGAVLTDDDDLAERARALRFHGSRDKVTYDEVGYNSRLDELQAALLRVLLPELDGWADGRRAAGRHYLDAGLGELVKPPTPTAGADPAWHLYVIRHPLVDRLGPALDRVGIGQRAYYRTPIHRQPAMRDYAPAHELPGTDEAARTHLAIPMSPRLDRINAIEVVSAIREARD